MRKESIKCTKSSENCFYLIKLEHAYFAIFVIDKNKQSDSNYRCPEKN